MRQFDRPVRPAASGLARLTNFGRLSDPTTLVCAALALAIVAMSMRIVSIW